ncbi:CG0192-related protein [Gordonia shandongensis]|uniref:CG0192-related protein n=1 Tax=Gordonia shandongensis TaxID=376351 RepID=UPI0003F88477|nr:hypothetical protein [Gordonia shandongensis]
MALLHDATLSPTKPEIVTAHLDSVPWGGSGPVEMLGAYRFDDPDGEVGVEAHIVARGGHVLHIPLTYRGAPIPGADEHLVATMKHSVLGERWVYDAAADPVAVGCFVRALRGEQAQADLEVAQADGSTVPRENTVRLHLDGAAGESEILTFSTDLAAPATGHALLVAQWDGGDGVVAALG